MLGEKSVRKLEYDSIRCCGKLEENWKHLFGKSVFVERKSILLSCFSGKVPADGAVGNIKKCCREILFILFN
jgi:hypothetical protein